MEKTLDTPLKSIVKRYLILTKPGIIVGNLVTATGGFTLASKRQFNFSLFLWMVLGLLLVIASSCIFNNYIDRKLDAKMTRTKYRALALKAISNKKALALAVLLGLWGFYFLFTFVNALTGYVALFGVIAYVIFYSFSKYHTSYGTLIGSMAGAVPPIVGYSAVSDRLDLAALLLFLIVTCWQMPHFYAIAIYRIRDYARGSIPVLPLIKGMHRTKMHMTAFVALFMIVSSLLTVFKFTNIWFAIAMIGLSIMWLWIAYSGFKATNDHKWARKMFVFSLMIIMAQNALIACSVI